MTIATQFMEPITPAGNGVLYTGYPAGNPPSPSWSAVPNFLNRTTSLSVNVLTTFITPTSGATCVLNGSLPTGWTFDGTTLSYNGTSINSTPSTVSFTATYTSTGITSTSNSFSVQGAGAPVADTTAPTVPLTIAVSAITKTTATITGNQSSDPSPPGQTCSGLAQYNVTVTGAPGSPFTVSSGGVGTEPIFTLLDVGTQTSSVSQSGADLTITTTAADAPYPTNSAVGAGGFQMAGTSWTASCLINAFTSTSAYDNLRLELRPSTSPTDAYVAIGVQPFNQSGGVFTEYRTAAGGSAAKGQAAALTEGPVNLLVTRSGDTYFFAYTVSGNAPTSLGSVTQVMGSTLYVAFGANSNTGASVSGTLKQCSVQAAAPFSLNLTGLTAGTTYPVTVTAQDVAGNTSAASASVSFTTTAAAPTIPAAPRFGMINIGGNNSTYLTAAAVQRMARADIVALGLNYEGAGAQCYTGSADSFVRAIKSTSVCGTKVVNYFLPDTDGCIPGTNPQFSGLISANNWYCWQQGTSGTKTLNYYNHSWAMANSTTYTPVDSNGHHLEDAAAQYCYQYYILGTYGGAYQSTDYMSTLDGFLHDNAQLRTPAGGYASVNSNACDWNRDGTSDYQTQVTSPTGAAIDQAYRNGLALWCNWFSTNAPGLLRIGNIAGWGDINAYDGEGNHTTGTNVTGVDQLWQGGFEEGLLGLSWGEENTSAALAMSMYQMAMAHANGTGANTGYPGPAAYWNSSGLDYWTSNNTPPTAWQAPRHHLAFTLQDDGEFWMGGPDGSGGPWYYADYNVTNFTWLDELCVNPSTRVCTGESSSSTGKGWMGVAIDPAWTKLGATGVYGRRYQNGSQVSVALWNPRGNGSQVITIATYYPGLRFWHLTGTAQSLSVNDGSIVTSVTLPDRSGLIGVLAP